MQTESPERELLTRKEVARTLGISARHVMRLAALGRMPKPVRLRRLTRWRKTQLQAWLAKGCPPVDELSAERER